MLTVPELLGPGGRLAGVIGPGYEARAAQLAMAERVRQAVRQARPLVVEAGTGTGKSWAYLAGGLAAGARVIVSTSSKALQGQLLHKDLPLLAQALPDLRFAVAKGKANYLCLEKIKGRYGLFGEYAWPADLDAAAMTAWAESTPSGDLDEAPATRNLDQIAAGDDCTGQHCRFYALCPYYRAKAAWLQAAVLVTNHALLLTELTRPVGLLTQDKRPLLLVCDEAHQLESYAVNALSAEITPRALRYAERLDPHVEKLSAVFLNTITQCYVRTDSDQMIPDADRIEEGLDLVLALRDLASDYWQGSLPPTNAADAIDYAVATRLRGLADRVKTLAEPTAAGCVRHVTQLNGRENSLTIAATAWDVAGLLARLPALATSTVYCSATLATSAGPGGLAYFVRNVGLAGGQYDQLVVGSPFNYPRQGLLYLPPAGRLPTDPNEPAYNLAAAEEIGRLLAGSQGRALLLFTSYAAMRQVTGGLRQRLPHLTFLEQGVELGRDAMLAQFRAGQGENLVLCGAKSFWEGVSLEGAQLALVIVDRVPFTPPGPVQLAKQAAIAARGGNWFVNLALPEATAALRQGVGRLIRTTTDRGVVALLDPRLTGRPWGRTVLNALPPLRITRDCEVAVQFLRGAYV